MNEKTNDGDSGADAKTHRIPDRLSTKGFSAPVCVERLEQALSRMVTAPKYWITDDYRAEAQIALDWLREGISTTTRALAAPAVVPAPQPPYPEGNVVGPCVCGSWPGGPCLRCEWIPAGASGGIPEQASGYLAGAVKKADSCLSVQSAFDKGVQPQPTTPRGNHGT